MGHTIFEVAFLIAHAFSRNLNFSIECSENWKSISWVCFLNNIFTPLWSRQIFIKRVFEYTKQLPHSNLHCVNSVNLPVGYNLHITMTANSILNTFWPLMRFLQFLGSCPIKKSTEKACGFKAMSFGCYFAISITSFLLGITGLIMALTYIMLMFDISVFELIQVTFGSKGLSTDILHFDLKETTFAFGHFITIYGHFLPTS